MDGNDANDLVEQILPYERPFFLWLNNSHNVFWDSFMWIYSDKYTWIPLLLISLLVFVYKTKWQHIVLFLLCFILLATMCDQLSASVIKPLFSRFRPTHHPDFKDWVLTVNNYRGGRFGFISSHAANGFGIAVFMSLVFKYRKLTILLFLWVLITVYSRIYLGVHFISDIVGGAFLGSIIGFLVYLLFQYCRLKILKESVEEISRPIYDLKRAKILCFAILISILSITVISLINFIYSFHWLY